VHQHVEADRFLARDRFADFCANALPVSRFVELSADEFAARASRRRGLRE